MTLRVTWFLSDFLIGISNSLLFPLMINRNMNLIFSGIDEIRNIYMAIRNIQYFDFFVGHACMDTNKLFRGI